MDNFNANTGEAAVNGWVYFLGEMTGTDIKVGYSTGETLRKRIEQVNREQMSTDRYVLLAGLRADRKDEAAVKRHYSEVRRTDKGSRQEYFVPAPELTEYVNWLRQWWWVTLDVDESIAELEVSAPEMWLPGPGRRLAAPPSDPQQLIQPFQTLEGPLASTPWDWFITPRASVQDYFTPSELIHAAREAMGGIDLDAASHPLANREHRIPDYFHINRSAFDHAWHGKVWLNPPYGNNAPWFEKISEVVTMGEIEQLCMLSPVWAFTTEQAKPVMRLSTAAILLSPTPKFWGNADNRTGVNHPHAIVYFGQRVGEFLAAFERHGIPFQLTYPRPTLREAFA